MAMSEHISAEDGLQFICTLVQASQTIKANAGRRARVPVTHLLSQAIHYFWAARDVPIFDRSRPRSRSAANASDTILVYDCAIPLGLLAEEMLNRPATAESVRQFLDDHLFVCLITGDEAHRLSTLDLRSFMPKGWQWGDDLFARYDAAEIDLVIVE
jgi:hypothetical protein